MTRRISGLGVFAVVVFAVAGTLAEIGKTALDGGLASIGVGRVLRWAAIWTAVGSVATFGIARAVRESTPLNDERRESVG